MDEKLVHNPSRFSELFNRVARESTESMEKRLSGGFFARVKFEGKLRAYLMAGYRSTYTRLRDFTLPDREERTVENIQKLVNTFKEIYPLIVFNNIALARIAPDGSFTVEVMTKEDEKNRILREFSEGSATCEEFKEQFGHYAFNGYEAQERRFSEYDCEELKKFGDIISQVPHQVKLSLGEYMEEKTGAATPSHLVGIRELGKNQALKIVSAIRDELIRLEKLDTFESSVFDHSYEDMIRL
ncbi:MAG: hypothetical protein U5L75_00095 [Candidatus Campbellbacteria bacterium]|nr:hypothetical protein [Candidatus Campbellbacteria bacterium]